MKKEELHKHCLEYLKKSDKQKEENDLMNPVCVRCGERIFGAVYTVEDKNLEKGELVFHNRCYDQNYVNDYLKAKIKKS